MSELSQDAMYRGVVITGFAATTSLGADAETTWQAMLTGQCGIGAMPDLESPVPPGSVGGQATELPAEYCPQTPREARYLRWTIEHALRDARVDSTCPYPAARRLAVLGTTLHGIRAGGRFLRSGSIAELGTFLASATSQLAMEGFGIEGGAITTCSACSSSLGAIALGVTLLETRQADLVVAGGYDTISEYAWAGFNALRLIADGPLRPFCRGRQGMKVAEGYGIVILERAASARDRGADVRAFVDGWGESADSHHLTQPHPRGEGALAAMQQALGRAGVRAEDIGMVAAHATGTPDNDAAEFQALRQLLGDRLSAVPVVGFKSFLGHTLGGAGAVELVFSCMALRDQLVPACPNIDAQDLEFAGLSVATGVTQARTVHATLNTSLGFGGANTSVVLTDHHVTIKNRTGASSRFMRDAAWITGIGILLPGAVGHSAFLDRVSRCSLTDWYERFETVDDSVFETYLNVRRARRMSEYVKLTLAVTTMAAHDADLNDQPAWIASSSAILGTMHGSASFCHAYYSQLIAEGALAANPVLFAEGVPNAAAAHLSTTFGIKGSCQTIIGSRTSGLDALALAALRIRSGAIDKAIVVAAEAPSTIVDRAYMLSGLQASHDADTETSRRKAFRRSTGAVAFIVESDRSAEARGALPYARLEASTSASSPAPARGGSAGAVASVLNRLGDPGRVIGSACNTWVDRAERVGMRRAGIAGESGSVHHRFGELFSVSPLVAIVTELVNSVKEPRCSFLCTDWSGAVTALTMHRLNRQLGADDDFIGVRP